MPYLSMLPRVGVGRHEQDYSLTNIIIPHRIFPYHHGILICTTECGYSVKTIKQSSSLSFSSHNTPHFRQHTIIAIFLIRKAYESMQRRRGNALFISISKGLEQSSSPSLFSPSNEKAQKEKGPLLSLSPLLRKKREKKKKILFLSLYFQHPRHHHHPSKHPENAHFSRVCRGYERKRRKRGFLR